MCINIDETVCFFGHRKIAVTKELRDKLYYELENLITDKGIKNFLFGSKSQFDDLCLEVVTDLKNKYPYIQRVYVRAEFPDIDDSYRKYLSNRYDDTYFPDRIVGAGKAVYVERNSEMIDKSSICAVYYDEKYQPPRRKHSKSDLLDYQPASGTGLAFKYAEKKKRKVLNFASL